ncbi:hypothetical protein RRG08_003233 [Elysia crispata]|uniref:Uncharacterized protein n=1 Tax=Elysia crispata TaxID=231223 RepID=A0AAE1E6T0_9GAST|nr:hypothetical protein RRG08_003233 [Elysia crispata]
MSSDKNRSSFTAVYPDAKGCYLAEHYPIQFADQKLSLKEAQQTFECGWFIQKDLEGNLKKKATKRLIKHIAITSYGLVIDTLRPLNLRARPATLAQLKHLNHPNSGSLPCLPHMHFSVKNSAKYPATLSILSASRCTESTGLSSDQSVARTVFEPHRYDVVESSWANFDLTSSALTH